MAGVFRVRGRIVQRVAVFIDYQNVYMRARDAFPSPQGIGGGHVHGQIRPGAVGLVLRGDDTERELIAVHVYRGMPSVKFDREGYSASQRQVAAWENRGGSTVHSHTRPLNYRVPKSPREKGIDVLLAIGVVTGAHRGDFDVAIIFSDDTDLDPVIEAVGVIMDGPGHAELATWQDPNRGPREVRSAGVAVPVHVLSQRTYSMVQDLTDYKAPTPRAARPPRR